MLSIIYIGSARSPGGRFSPSPSQGHQLHGQTHHSTIHQPPNLHQPSLSGESPNNGRSGFPIHNSFLQPSSIPVGIPPGRPLGLISEEGRTSGLSSPTNEMSSKNFLERSLKHMAAAAAAASSKADTKCK